MIAEVHRLEDFGARIVVPPAERYAVYLKQSEGLARKKSEMFWREIILADREAAAARYNELTEACRHLHKSQQARHWLGILEREPWVADFRRGSP